MYVTIKGTILQIVLIHVRCEGLITYSLRGKAQSEGVVAAQVVAQSRLVLQLRPRVSYRQVCMDIKQVL